MEQDKQDRQEQDVKERIQRAEKAVAEIMDRERLTCAIQEVMINGKRVNYGLVFMPRQEEQKIVAPPEGFMNRAARRLMQAVKK